ncbi:hypothetical protein ABPG77_003499 [Micractinium sp. CCAP 211/92]
MATSAAQAAPVGPDSAPLLAEGSEQRSVPLPARNADVEQPSSSGEEVEPQAGSRWSWLSWFRGSRPQRLPAEDAEELQERGGQPSVAVMVEAAGGDGSGPLEATSSGSSSIGGEGGGAGQAGAADSNAEIQPRQSGSPRMARLPSRGQPTCLICLEEFRQEEFINGAALRLECSCRGDLALRHRDCVMKWVQVKGSNVCELCKSEIRNIPAPPPRPVEADMPALDEAYFNDPNHIHDFMPSSQDLVFDCIRVCWVAMIVSILFFEMSLGAALWTGMLAGLAYSIMVRLMYRQHFFAMRRLAEQQAAARREQEAAAADGGAGEAPGPATTGAPPVVVAV